MKAKVYNNKGKAVGEMNLKPEVFGVEVNPTTVYESVRAHMANKRTAVAHTKTRSDVRGGGKKPWKQKGTGRARQGSIRSPQWIGGGIVFGPSNERNFSLKLNKKAKQTALCMALSDKLANDRLVIVDDLGLKEYKTKDFLSVINSLPCSDKKVLVALPGKVTSVVRAARNIADVNVINAQSLNIIDILKYEYVLLTQPAVEAIEEMYA